VSIVALITGAWIASRFTTWHQVRALVGVNLPVSAFCAGAFFADFTLLLAKNDNLRWIGTGEAQVEFS